jgi:hypothetical protein
MKIEDLIELLENRLREFKLSRDYARMSGDLERMNAADKEIIGLEDTLYQLNLLADTSRSAAVREEVLTEVITDGSVAILGEYDITSYATDPLHEEKIMYILSHMGVMDTAEKIDSYIKGRYSSSPVAGEMVMSASVAYNVDTRLVMAIMEQDSSFGTAGLAVRTLNPGNVGNDDAGNTRTYASWQEGVTAVAEWLNRHRTSGVPFEEVVSGETGATPTQSEPVATSTPAIIIPITATSTPTSTIPMSTSTTSTTSTTTTTTTNTPIIETSATSTANSTPINIPTSTTSTTTTTGTPTNDTQVPTVTPMTTTTSTTTTAGSTPAITIPVSTPEDTNSTSSTDLVESWQDSTIQEVDTTTSAN